MPSFLRFSVPRPPEEPWKRRLAFGVLGVLALGAVVVGLKGDKSSAPTAARRVTAAAVPTTTSTLPPTATTVDPKAVSAAVAALYSHEGPTPQELASVPSSSKAGNAHHAKSGGGHSHH